jgi:hypothetical protein
MSRVGASMAAQMIETPTGKLSQTWPHPQRFPRFLDRFGKMMSEDYDWSAQIARLPMSVLLGCADDDSIPQRHIAEFIALLCGGVKEPGWVNTKLSESRLAIVPGYSLCLLKSPFPLIASILLAIPTYASRPSCPLSSRSC